MNTTFIADEFSTLGVQWSWREVLRAAALAQLGLLLATMVALRDVLAAGLAVILVVCICAKRAMYCSGFLYHTKPSQAWLRKVSSSLLPSCCCCRQTANKSLLAFISGL